MKQFVLLTFSAIFLLISCQSNKIQEGEIIYEITYPNAEISGFMKAILPETMTIIFSGTKMKSTIARGEIFSTEIVSDESERSIEMRLDFGDKLLYTTLDENEIELMIGSQPNYTITPLNQTDSIVGLSAKSYSIEAKDTLTRNNYWFTEDLSTINAYWFTAYSQIQGMPLIFDIERYGVMMHLEAVEFKAKEVSEMEFERENELEQTTYKQFESEVQELFDILME